MQLENERKMTQKFSKRTHRPPAINHSQKKQTNPQLHCDSDILLWRESFRIYQDRWLSDLPCMNTIESLLRCHTRPLCDSKRQKG